MKEMEDQGMSSRARAAKMAGISRRSHYYAPRPRIAPPRPDKSKVRGSVRRIALRYVTYGPRRVWAMIRREGWTINRKRAHRLMREERRLRPAHFPRPRLLSTGALEANRPNAKWYTDLTCIDTTDRGPCSLTSILDGRTREMIARSFLPNCGAAEAIEVVQAAVAKEFPRKLRVDGVVLR